MPNRILREGILTSRPVSCLSDDAQLLYTRLLLIADDYGRYDFDVELLRARLFPLLLERWPLSRVDLALRECCKTLVRVYGSDKRYLEIRNFRQQTRSSSKYPAPSEEEPDQPLAEHVHSTCVANDINCTLRRSRISETYSETQTKAVAPLVRGSNTFISFWERWVALTQRAQRKEESCRAWLSVVPNAIQNDAMACLERYGASDEVRRGVIANPDNWLYQQAKDAFKGTWQPATQNGTGKSDLEARRQVAILEAKRRASETV